MNQTPPQRPPSGASFLRSFRHANYRLFFGGQFISLIGTWMQSVAQSWLVYRLTGSSLQLGMIGFASMFPVFLLSIAGGAVADSGNRHRIMLYTQSSSMLLALITAILTLTGTIQVWHLYILATCLGIANAFDVPARQAFIVEMVGREDLHNAIALNSSMFNGARLIGPMLAGILVGLIGEGWCFLLNGLSYLAVIACLLRMVLPPPAPRPHRTTSALDNMIQGVRYAAAHPLVRAILVLLGVTSLFGFFYAVLMPVFADRIFQTGPHGLGILVGANGCGAMLGALFLASRSSSGLNRYIHRAAFGFGISQIAFSFCPLFIPALAILALTGLCMVVYMAAANTTLQLTVPDAYRGRIMSLFSMMLLGMAPFGSMLGGALAHWLGVEMTVRLGGAACCVIALAAGRHLRTPVTEPAAC